MKKGKILICVGLILIEAALFWIGYNLWDDHRAEKASEKILEQLAPTIKEEPVPVEGVMRYRTAEADKPEEDEIEYPDYVLDPDKEMPTQKIDGCEYVGILTIPILEQEFPICNDWSYDNLSFCPCRYTGTAYRDNMVICAHNYSTHFGSIKELSYGDIVIFTDMDGNVFRYEVVEIETLDPHFVQKMITGDWDLTLFTCTIGGATRVTVRCEKME